MLNVILFWSCLILGSSTSFAQWADAGAQPPCPKKQTGWADAQESARCKYTSVKSVEKKKDEKPAPVNNPQPDEDENSEEAKFPIKKLSSFAADDICSQEQVSIGTRCKNNVVYVGKFEGKKYWTPAIDGLACDQKAIKEKTESCFILQRDAGFPVISFAWNLNTTSCFSIEATSRTDGRSNTDRIASKYPDSMNAAAYCKNLRFAGYKDWFLPAKEEVLLLYENRKLIGPGIAKEPMWGLIWSGGSHDGLEDRHVWSSTEVDACHAWEMSFSNPVPDPPHYIHASFKGGPPPYMSSAVCVRKDD